MSLPPSLDDAIVVGLIRAMSLTVTTPQNLSKDVAEFRARFQKSRVEMNGRFDEVNRRFDRLEQCISDECDRLYSRLRALHEELVSHIEALGQRSVGPRPRSPGPRRGDRKR